MAYSDSFITEALIKLAYNKHNYKLTAEQLGISTRTLKQWEKKYPKKTVPQMLDRAITRLLADLPAIIPSKDYGIILGILIDKWLILTGHPTQRSESVLGKLGELSADELSDVIREAEQIVQEAYQRSDRPGTG